MTGATTPLGEAVLATLGERGVAACDDPHIARRRPSGDIIVPQDGIVDPAALTGLSGIVNCMARTTGSADELARANVDYPLRLAASAKRAGISRFIQEGSVSVFGPIERIDPDSPIAPATDYARSRVAAEASLAALNGDGFATAVLRIPFLFSAMHPGALGRLIAAIMRSRILPIRATADAARSMMTYADAAELMVALALEERTPPPVAAAADPEPVVLARIAKAIAARTGRRILTLPVPEALVSIGRSIAPGPFNSLFRSSTLADAANLRGHGSPHPVGAEIDIYIARLTA